jgi:hypothetical protein
MKGLISFELRWNRIFKIELPRNENPAHTDSAYYLFMNYLVTLTVAQILRGMVGCLVQNESKKDVHGSGRGLI